MSACSRTRPERRICSSRPSWPRLDSVTQPDPLARQVAVRLDVSEQTLRRRCASAIGMGPKMLERVLRFRRAVRLPRSQVPPVEAARLAGYADRAHLSNELTRVAGATPGRLSCLARPRHQLERLRLRTVLLRRPELDLSLISQRQELPEEIEAALRTKVYRVRLTSERRAQFGGAAIERQGGGADADARPHSAEG